MPPAFASDEPGRPETFASTLAEAVREARDGFGPLRTDLETAAKLAVFPALLVPLYPALLATRLLLAPRRLAARRRWPWLLEGGLLLLLSPLAAIWAVLALLIPLPGASSPPIYPTLWLLPGLSAAAGLAAIAIGIAPRSRFARFVLGVARST
jgi:hypothetical protein